MEIGPKGVYFLGVNKYLYESIPDVFPFGYLTENEAALWAKFAEESNKKHG